MTGEQQSAASTERNPSAHEDRIERLNRVFYIRWTSGPDYERAFLCVEDGEPDMNSFAATSFGCAHKYSRQACKPSPPSPLVEQNMVERITEKMVRAFKAKFSEYSEIEFRDESIRACLTAALSHEPVQQDMVAAAKVGYVQRDYADRLKKLGAISLYSADHRRLDDIPLYAISERNGDDS